MAGEDCALNIDCATDEVCKGGICGKTRGGKTSRSEKSDMGDMDL